MVTHNVRRRKGDYRPVGKDFWFHCLFRAACFVGFRVPAFCQVGLDAPPGGGDWFSVEEPRGVGEAVLDALELAEDGVKVVRTSPKEPQQLHKIMVLGVLDIVVVPTSLSLVYRYHTLRPRCCWYCDTDSPVCRHATAAGVRVARDFFQDICIVYSAAPPFDMCPCRASVHRGVSNMEASQ